MISLILNKISVGLYEIWQQLVTPRQILQLANLSLPSLTVKKSQITAFTRGIFAFTLTRFKSEMNKRNY